MGVLERTTLKHKTGLGAGEIAGLVKYFQYNHVALNPCGMAGHCGMCL